MDCFNIERTHLHYKVFSQQFRACILLLFVFFIGNNSSFAQCPTVSNTNPSFCDIDSPKIANLQATDNGSGVAWFATTISTTPLPPSTELLNGQTYFLDNSSGNCGSRTPVTVSIYGAPTGQNFQGVCVSSPTDATIAILNANGNNVQWYTVPTGGTALPSTTVLTTNTIYYAGQTNPITGCLTSRLPVFVVVNVIMVPVGENIQVFCNDSNNPPTVNDLIASGNNNWYLTNTSVLVLAPDTPLVDGQTYYGTTTVPPCESTQRLEVTVNLIPENDPGENGGIILCESDLLTPLNVNLFDSLGGTPSNLGVWSGPFTLSNGALGTLDVSNLNFEESPYVFTYTVDNSIVCPPKIATVTVTVIKNANAGIDATQTFCESDAPTDLFLFLTGNPDMGGTWSPPLASGSGIFNPLVDLAGTYTYTVSGTQPCASDTANVVVSVIKSANAGTGSNMTLCESDASIDLFLLLTDNPDSGGTWSPALSSGTSIFDPSIDAQGIYTYTVPGIQFCPSDVATVTIEIIPNANAGIDANANFCESDLPTDLFNFLGGTPDIGGTWSPVLSSGTGVFNPLTDTAGIYTYTVINDASCLPDVAMITVSIFQNLNPGIDSATTLCENDTPVDLFTFLTGNPDTGGTWSPTLSSGTGVFDPSIDPSGIYTYTLTGSTSCPSVSSIVEVTVIDNLSAGIDDVATFCDSDSPSDLFTFLGGAPDSGGTWSPALSSGTGVFNPAVDLPGVYTYTISGNSFCSPDSATITVSVFSNLNPGISNTATFCENDVPVDLFTFLGGTPDSGGTWSPALSSGTGIFNPSVDPSGVYFYTLSGSVTCPPVFSMVEVTVIENLNAGDNASVTFCENETPTDLFSLLGGTPDVGGVWSPTLNSGTGIFNPSIDVAGVYTYTHVGQNSCPSDSATVTVTIDPFLGAGGNGIFNICETDLNITNTINLFDNLTANPSNTGTWSGPQNTINGYLGTLNLLALTPSATPYLFTYTVTNSNSCPTSQATVSVLISPKVNAGTNGTITLCKNDTPKNLIIYLGGNPSAGGTWTPSLNSGTGVFNPATDLAGTYTYTLPATAFCPSASSTVTVSLVDFVNSGISGTVTFCENDAPTDLFSVLGGTPDVGGIWTPALASNSGVFDPAVDAPGVYTYSVTGTSPCPSSSSTVTVLVDQLPSNTLAQINIGTICLNTATNVNITNANNLPNGNYPLTYEITGEIIFTETISVSFVNGSTAFTIPASVFNSNGTSTITIQPIQSNVGNSCGLSGNLFAPVTFTIEEVKTPTYNGTNTFCEAENATISNLTSTIIGTETIVWYDAPSNGNVYNDTDVLIDETTYYAAIVTASGCESAIRLAVTVIIDECKETQLIIPDGFSPNGDQINDFFEIKNIATLYPKFSIQIFNRWGNLVFEGNAQKPNWDGNNHKGGTVSGEHMPTGVYFFIINFNDGIKKDLQGRLYLSK
ncbi:gliding motility-associated C-terminal domain-containing protein [Flavobacterium sp.]|uniref:gliding motility-associated C-terminal domain-containing protein n=1 Tax=Flavobacterium sp. TaxID=239 RepID=UPI00261F2F4F|nr:gliding motility-associated C-terminal domain-containing protein [Flavobacterium sp.]MDD3003381.1 gliding motility-associated C-terminal domain-containing protein [Flavobacterium sp.]